jgi:hypothetical protein
MATLFQKIPRVIPQRFGGVGHAVRENGKLYCGKNALWFCFEKDSVFTSDDCRNCLRAVLREEKCQIKTQF